MSKKNKKQQNKWIEADRQDDLKKMKSNHDINSFDDNTIAMDMLFHLCYVMQNTYEKHILEDPSVILNKNLYKKAYKINVALWEFYQEVGNHTGDKR